MVLISQINPIRSQINIISSIMKTKIAIFCMLLCTFSLHAKKEQKLPDSYAFNRGVEAYQEGKNQDALDWFNKEISDNPNNGYAYIYISALRFGNEEYGKALSAINQALKKLPKKDTEYNAIAYGTRGMIYFTLEDTISGLKDYDMAIKLEPENSKHYDRRAQIFFEQKKYDLADADYDQMIRIDPGDVMGYMGLGRNLKEQELYDEAIEKFNYVIKMEPDYDSGYSFRAECNLKQKKYSEAIDDLIKALSISGDRKAYFLLVTIDEAALPLVKAKLQVQANKEPNEAAWPHYIGIVLEHNNREKEAISFYEQAQSRDANPLFLERIANCYFSLGDYNSALDYINRAINMDSNDYDLILTKGNIYNEMGKYAEAIAELDKYIERYPDHYFGYYRRGWFKDEANDIDGAIDDYTMSITLEPRYAYAYCGRGRFYNEQGKTDLAKLDFEKVIELDTVPDPGTSCAHYAYFFLGQKEKAEQFMYKLIETNEDRAGTFYDAACLYSIMGEPDKAIDYLSKAFDLGYRRIAHIYADHDLDNIRNLPEFMKLMEKYAPIDGEIILDEIKSQDEIQELVEQEVEVPFSKENGVTKVKCEVNGLPLYFVFDTGAADVTMSMVEANFMLKNDYIKPNDIVGTARYVDANGDINEGTIINLRKVNFGGLELDNVRASVVRNQKAPLLLGQSVLGRLGKIEIDNPNRKLIITR